MSIPTLYPFQVDLVERVRAAAKLGHKRIVIQAPTGAGKTSVASLIAQQAVAKGNRCLFLVHLRKLVDQISDRLTDFHVDHGIIMAGEKPYSSAPVQVASRDTIVSRCFTHEWNGLPTADIVFVDEAHHAIDPASDHRKIINQYPNARILLMTATPVGSNGQGMGPWAQAIECAAPTSKLIEGGYLCPLKCYAPDRKKARGGKFKRGIAGDLVESWKAYGEDRPTVLFCSRVQHSRDAVAAYNAAGISAAHVDSDTADYERDRVFDGLETGEIRIVSNVGIIKEGVDIPCLGCCQLFMDVKSRVALLQAIGRIMRPYPGKSHGIVIDHAGAVFRHGFPDEDQEWTLEGNVDEDFKKKHDAGLTEKVLYCKVCERIYHGGPACPQCGKMPAKPPKSIFAAPPVDASGELLVEAERGGSKDVYSLDEKITHWKRCLGVAANKGGKFTQASVIYKQRYGEWPGNDFPFNPSWNDRQRPVAEVFPQFLRGSKVAT